MIEIFSAGDLKIISAGEDDPDLQSVFFRSEVREFLSEIHSYQQPMPLEFTYKILHKGKLAGRLSFKSIRWFNRKAEISIAIIPEFQKQGIGSRVLQQALSYAFTVLNLHRLEAEVVQYNQRGIHLFKNSGFKEEGRLREARFYKGDYYDIIRFGILKKEYLSLQNG
ncbi:MAG: GNAT family protein [Calditrichia bacterium]